MTIGNFSGLYPNYPMYTNTVYPSTNPIGKDEANPNAVDPSADPDKVKKPGKRSSPEDCETCANRKYQDGSDENVSFKTASHISPESAGARVRAHEGIRIMHCLFRIIVSLKFLDDVTTSPLKFFLVLARTIQPIILISVWMEY